VVELLAHVRAAVVGVRLEAGLEVGARGEAAAGARDENRADRRVGGLAVEHLLELVAELRRPRVQAVRPVEGQPAGAAGLLPDQGLVAHPRSSSTIGSRKYPRSGVDRVARLAGTFRLSPARRARDRLHRSVPSVL